MNSNRTTRLCVCALFIAASSVISAFLKFSMPQGGEVTFFSLVPIVIICFSYGAKYGMLSAFVYSVIQLILGANNLSYGGWWGGVLAIILLDYFIAYFSLGLLGFLKNKTTKSKVIGIVVVCLIRFICHFISGVTIFKVFAIGDPIVYSLTYNAWYMIPETVLTVFGFLVLNKYGFIKNLEKYKLK